MVEASEDTGARFVIAVEDINGAWSSVQDLLKSRLPLRNLAFPNKFGKKIAVEELPVQYLLSSDPKLQRLRPYAQSPVTWFRNPYATLLVVACEDGEEYRRALKAQLRAFTEGAAAKDPLSGGAEWLMLLVRPPNSDALARGPRKVFEALRYDFKAYGAALRGGGRERAARLHLPAGAAVSPALNAEIEALEQQLKECIMASFEIRAAAYEEEVRRLMASRLEPGWRFSTLYLVKDSLGVMLEAAGLAEDALREFFELEATYLESAAAGGGISGHEPEARHDGADSAVLLRATWRDTRRAVLRAGGVADFTFRQYLFACQARVLLRLGRPQEVTERGLAFVKAFSDSLAAQQAAGSVPPLFREAWAFSACTALAHATLAQSGSHGSSHASTRQPQETPAGKRSPAGDALAVTPAQPNGLHHESSAIDLSNTAVVGDTSEQARVIAIPAESFGSRDDSLGGMMASASSGNSLPDLQGQPRLQHLSMASSNLATFDEQPSGSPARHSRHASLAGPGSGSELGTPASGVLHAAERDGLAAPSVNWQLGALAEEAAGEAPGVGAAAMLPSPPRVAQLCEPPSTTADAAFWGVIGHLYAAARAELVRLGRGAKRPSRFGQDEATLSWLSPMRLPANGSASRPGSPDAAGGPSLHPLVHSADSSPELSSRQPAGPTAESSTGESSGPAAAAPAAGAAPPPGTAAPAQQQQQQPLGQRLLSRLSRSSGSTATAASEAAQPHGRHQSTVSIDLRSTPDVEQPAQPDGAEAKDPQPLLMEVAQREDSVTTGKDDSTSVSGSEASQAAFDKQLEAAAAVAQPPSPKKSLHTDPRFIEQEVETASESSSPRSVASEEQGSSRRASFGQQRPQGREASAGAAPPWLTDWRLKLALSSKELFEELYIELSAAAARCYSRCGRHRSAAAMRADVADALAARGQLLAAAALYERQASLLLREGWASLAASVLLKLAAAQKDLDSLTLPATYVALLSLSADETAGVDRAAVQAELEQCAQQAGTAPVPSILQDAAADPARGLDTLAMLRMAPLPGSFSRFYGDTGAGGAPITLPPAQPLLADGAGTSTGAQQLSVGDIATLAVQVHSMLPDPISLHSLSLRLMLLQETSVTTFESPTAFGGDANHSRAGSIVGESLGTAAGIPPLDIARPASPAASTAATAATEQAPSFNERVSVQWLPTEELLCPLADGKHEMSLNPGANELRFQASPVKAGLYAARGIAAQLGSLRLALPLLPPATLRSTPGSWTRPSGGFGEGGSQEVVLLEVGSVQRRAACSVLAAQGGLTAGSAQWLGLVVAPLADALHQAQLQLSAFGPPGSGGGLPAVQLPLSQAAVVAPLPDGSIAASFGACPPSAGTDNSSSQPEPQQVDVRRGAVQLPEWAARRPSVVWLRVQAAPRLDAPELVRVAAPGAWAAAAAAASGRVLSDTGSLPAEPISNGSAGSGAGLELDVGLQYERDCRRSHACHLSVPLAQPFRVHVRAWEVGDKRVAVQATLASRCAHPLTVTACHTQPQGGFSAATDLLAAAGLLPVRLEPRASLALGSVLLIRSRATASPSKPRGAHSEDSSVLEVQYRVEHSPAAAVPAPEVAPLWGPLLLAPGAAAPLPDAPPLLRGAAEAQQDCVFRHAFNLEVSREEGTPRGTVVVRLLGPFTAKLDQPVTLCWRLERGPGGSGAPDTLQYEVVAEGEGWQPRTWRPGSVGLPAAAGASATVEASWLPTAPGPLPVPRLQLLDVAQQEVFDGGLAADTVYVMPPDS